MSSPSGDKLVVKEDVSGADVSGAGVLSPGRRVVSPVVIGEDVSQVELSPMVVVDVVTSVAGMPTGEDVSQVELSPVVVVDVVTSVAVMRYGVLTSGVAIFNSTNGQCEWFANACTSAWLSYPCRSAVDDVTKTGSVLSSGIPWDLNVPTTSTLCPTVLRPVRDG